MTGVKRSVCWPLGFLLAAGCWALPALGSDWPEFRGPAAQGLASGKDFPLHWSASSNVTWKTAIPGSGWSSPVISGGRVFLTSAVREGAEISLRALCLAADGGQILWNVEVVRAGAGAARQLHNKNSLASPTPVVRDGRVYTHFGHMGTAALDLDGKILWTQTGLEYPPVHGNGGSPLLIGGLLVFGCDGAEDPFIAGLDAATGAIRWRTPRQTTARNKFSFSTPLALETPAGPVIISAASGLVAAYAPKDGRELWRVRYGEGYSVVPRPVFGNGLLYVSSGFDRPVIHAIDPAGAAGDVTESHVRWKQTRGAPNTPSLLLSGGELYMVSDAGIASCLDAVTGETLWSERLGGNFSASPAAAEGCIYFINESGTAFVLAEGREFRLLAKNELGERTLASPALAGGSVWIRTESHLWRIGRNRPI